MDMQHLGPNLLNQNLLVITRQNHIVIKECQFMRRLVTLKTTCIDYLVVPVGQKSRCGLAGCLWLKISREAAASVLLMGCDLICRLD